MSIIDDVRIKQDIDKDGKYVCDLNHKEETKFDINLRKAMSSNKMIHPGKFIWGEEGIAIKEGSLSLTNPQDFMDAALAWFEYSKTYGWKFPSDNVSKERYITLIISDLEKLI